MPPGRQAAWSPFCGTPATCSRENAVTGFAFGLFVLIVLAAAIGPYIVPYDPLASDTAVGPQAAVAPRTGSAPISSAATCSAA